MKVSVITTTYHHEKTLARAIASVWSQKNIEYEHIVINDNEKHQGMMLSYLEGFKKATGDYIAFCDGDDRWTDDKKLLRQVEYMEEHPECGLCLHRVLTEEGGVIKRDTVSTDYINSVLDFDHILRGSAYIYAQSYLIRKSVFDKYVDFEDYIRRGFKLWDLAIVLELSKHTKFHCMNFIGAIYTKNVESVTNTRSRVKRLKYVLAQYKIKVYFMLKYGCKMLTTCYLIYRFSRHLLVILLKRWK